MVNYRAAGTGKPSTFDATAPIPSMPDLPADSGADWNALSRTMAGLSGHLQDLAARAQRKDELAAVDQAKRDALSAVQAGDQAGTEPAPTQRRPRGALSNNPIAGKVRAAAEAAGLPGDIVAGIVAQESGFDPARRPIGKDGRQLSSAFGLFQLLKDERERFGLGDSTDVDGQIKAGIAKMGENWNAAKKALGRDPTPGEFYAVYYQGIGAGPRILANPSGDFRATLDTIKPGWGGKVLAANPWLSGIKTNADFVAWSEKKIASRMGGAAPAPAPSVPPQPLALRPNGTPAADAYNDTVREAMLWRQDRDIRAEIADIEKAAAGDPDAIEAALNKAMTDRIAALPDDFKRDPETIELLTKTYAVRSGAAIADARAKREQAADLERRQGFDDATAAARTGIERAAFQWGANPQGDQAVTAEIGRATAAIDAAVTGGLITPTQGDKKKRDLIEDATAARVRGTFSALPDPAAQERFASDLMDRWSKGDEMFAGLSGDKARALVTELRGEARRAAAATTADARAKQVELRRLVADDLASVKATGKGIDWGGKGFDAASIAATLGPAEAAKWVTDRQVAADIHAGTAGLDRLTPDDIAERLKTLAPEPGTDGFADRQEVFEAVKKRADALMKARAADPALAADEAFELTDAEPEKRAAARITAQEAMGIPELAREPLTQKEAKDLMAPVLRAVPGQEMKALEAVMAAVDERYGAMADEVAGQLIRVTGVNREVAGRGAALIRKLGMGQAPTVAETRGMDKATERSAAERFAPATAPMTPTAPKIPMKGAAPANPAAPAPSLRQLPSRAAIDALKANPAMAVDFDAKFGAGAASLYLGTVTEAETEDYFPQ